MPPEVLDVAVSDLGSAVHWAEPELLAEVLKVGTGEGASAVLARGV